MNYRAIIDYLDNYLTRTGRTSIEPVEANELLTKAGLLKDSKDRPGKPLRDLLRKGQLPHAFQSGGKGSSWTIPHSNKQPSKSSNYKTSPQSIKKVYHVNSNPIVSKTVDITKLKKELEKARLKYKPNSIKYLLVAEAPPNSVERFFYYADVRQHDYLFLGVAQALYPNLKEEFLASGRSSDIKNTILLKFKEDGFYLLDLSELPLSYMTGDLHSQLPSLVERVKMVFDKKTKIILIKATVYDAAFQYLKQEGFENIVEIRIPFPGQGGQKLFQDKFEEALRLTGYF